MKAKFIYDPQLNLLTAKEQNLLDKASDAVKKFVSRSGETNQVNHKTRDAHATTYGSMKGRFNAYDHFEERSLFPLNELSCFIRVSNAHMKIVSPKKTIPAFGFSIKMFDDEGFILNLPLVNFPLFPINSVSRFLRIFTAINYFFSGGVVAKFWESIKILKNIIAISPAFFHPSFVSQILKWISKSNNFILSFDYHSIGAYRFGDHIVKYKLVPLGVPLKFENERIDLSIENYILNHDYELELQVQYCYNLKDQPVNVLNQQWKNSEFIPIGKIKISQFIDKRDQSVEQQSFNPFESRIGLQPVGKIQKLRDQAYQVSLESRTT